MLCSRIKVEAVRVIVLFSAQPECSLGNSDLVIVIDASTSVTQQNFDKQLEFSKDLLRGADIDSGL